MKLSNSPRVQVQDAWFQLSAGDNLFELLGLGTLPLSMLEVGREAEMVEEVRRADCLQETSQRSRFMTGPQGLLKTPCYPPHPTPTSTLNHLRTQSLCSVFIPCSWQ